ncbi:helix-turn-helix domain-containing protein [Sinorhizobium medicae]|uniref:Transcriptional regulator n=1 Tax=Sinorhizobium medicae TaxID=110321 RepID=A0ABX4TQY5_9HYPH|nr:helix-turn-helix transcriptional regulator [Sinorhizobium medicae]MDX0598878.1 helix-turn-helix domain-containing protein [Sinorhizobium medicae]MDX0695058.1 helix-turn-helix domain-containing protein [Sinorhizobium medicae]MDX0744847.1 helix-turn-helix domain-containing protein [Sinorhizobium medicae]MDX0801719.1 helix-turn-helix domain-containing protein [Sinorhizobium medicae]MDX1194622.1 helix-turn-helix domain-containing protein [Sinorhizobium medicae]
MDDVAEIARMIHRLEEAGLSRREIAEGSQTSPSAISRIANLNAKNPTFAMVKGIRAFYHRHFPNSDPHRRNDLQQRFAPGCQPRAGR